MKETNATDALQLKIFHAEPLARDERIILGKMIIINVAGSHFEEEHIQDFVLMEMTIFFRMPLHLSCGIRP